MGETGCDIWGKGETTFRRGSQRVALLTCAKSREEDRNMSSVRVMGDVWEMYGRCMGDVWEMYGRKIGESDGRCMGDVREGDVWEMYGRKGRETWW